MFSEHPNWPSFQIFLQHMDLSFQLLLSLSSVFYLKRREIHKSKDAYLPTMAANSLLRMFCSYLDHLVWLCPKQECAQSFRLLLLDVRDVAHHDVDQGIPEENHHLLLPRVLISVVSSRIFARILTP